MAKTKFSTAASAGFMPFDLVELQELWSNVRDGNYWSAFKRAIRILDGVINPTEGFTKTTAWNPEIGEQVDECCEQLQQWVDGMNRTVASKVVKVRPELSEPGTEAIDIGGIIQIVNLVVSLLREWRRRKDGPPQAQVTGVTGNAPVMPGSGLPTGVQQRQGVRTPVFPANVEVSEPTTNAGQPAVTPQPGNISPASTQQPPKRNLFGSPKPPMTQPATGNESTPVDPEAEPERDASGSTPEQHPEPGSEGDAGLDQDNPEGDSESVEGETDETGNESQQPVNLSQGGQSDAMRKMQEKSANVPPRPATPARPATRPATPTPRPSQGNPPAGGGKR